MKGIPFPRYEAICTRCGKPVYSSDEFVASKPKGRRGWVYAHSECLKFKTERQKDSGVRLK